MAKNFAVAVLDIGTTGVRMLVGRVGENGTPKIIAKADAACRGGIKRIDDYDRGGLPDAIAEVVDSVKHKTGLEVSSCYVSLKNDNVYTVNNTGGISLKEGAESVTAGDIGELLNDASAVDLADEESLIDVIPLAYYADGRYIKGKLEETACQKLTVDANVVIAKKNDIEKIEKILRDVGLSIDGFIPSFFAAQKVLPSAYFVRQGGIACFTLVADVGGDITEYSLYYNGIPFSFGVLNVGGSSITKDLSIVLNISQNEAERLKLDYPIAASVTPGSDVEVAIFPLEKGEREMVNVSYVVEIMQARMQEMTKKLLSAAMNDMIASGITVPKIDRMVLIGEGIAGFSGVPAALEDVVGDTELEVVNVGRDIGMKNAYSIATGMLLYISSSLKYGRSSSKIIREATPEKSDEEEQKKQSAIGKLGGKIKSWLSLFKD